MFVLLVEFWLVEIGILLDTICLGFDFVLNREKITQPNIVGHLFHIGLKYVKFFIGMKIILNVST
jgi:hypothetical protein